MRSWFTLFGAAIYIARFSYHAVHIRALGGKQMAEDWVVLGEVAGMLQAELLRGSGSPRDTHRAFAGRRRKGDWSDLWLDGSGSDSGSFKGPGACAGSARCLLCREDDEDAFADVITPRIRIASSQSIGSTWTPPTPHLPMQMRPGDTPGAANFSNHLSGRNQIARLNQDFGLVQISGIDPLTMIDHGGVAAHGQRAGKHHSAGAGARISVPTPPQKSNPV